VLFWQHQHKCCKPVTWLHIVS